MATAAHRARDRGAAETAGAYLKAAGIGVRPPGAWGRRAPAKAANETEVTTGSDAAKPINTVHLDCNPNPNLDPGNLPSKGKATAKPANADEVTTGFGVELSALEQQPPQPVPSASLCEPFRDAIELGLSQGRNATAIWQDLVSESGFRGGYQTVKRFVHKLRGNQPLQARAVIITAPGEESQVDYGTGPMVKLGNLQAERERDKIRHEAESANLQGKLEDLSRKLEKQSGEQLGEEAELDLFTELRHAFPDDKIERIGRGVKGADIVHQIMDGTKVAGRIVYESKNTSTWQNGYIAQAKKYQTQYETPHVMVVSRVFPSKHKGLCVVKGVPVIEKRVAVAPATVIREGIIDIARLRLSGKFRDEKSQELFDYIVGDKFCTRFREIADGIASLRAQQQKERTWHENAWQAEAKIHDRIENSHREVDAQIGAIVRRGSNGRSTKFAAESQGLQDLASAAHSTDPAAVPPTTA
jgi:hypothetical protein